MSATAPVFIVDGLDISAYRTAADAALSLEGPDVLDGSYRMFDATGRRFVLTSAGGSHDYSARVSATLADAPAAPSELAEALRQTLQSVGLTVPPKSTLGDLVWAFTEKFGYEK